MAAGRIVEHFGEKKRTCTRPGSEKGVMVVDSTSRFCAGERKTNVVEKRGARAAGELGKSRGTRAPILIGVHSDS